MKKSLYTLVLAFTTFLFVMSSTKVYLASPSTSPIKTGTGISYYSDYQVLVAGGNPIILCQQSTSGSNVYTNVYYDLGEIGVYESGIDLLIDLSTLDGSIDGNTKKGFNLKHITIAGGNYNSDTNGNTHVTMTGGYVKAIYGGGYSESRVAKVNGSTAIQLLGNAYASNIFGGGFCRPNSPGSAPVTGNTSILINTSSNSKITSIYGGSQGYTGKSDVDGDTSIIIKDAKVDTVQGGGKSINKGSSNVGNTSITIEDGSIETVFGGGSCNASPTSSATAENTSIKVTGGTISGSIALGGSNESNSGNTKNRDVSISSGEINVTGGNFTGTGNLPNIIGGCVSNGDGRAIVSGISKINISGGSFSRTSPNVPVISGGGGHYGMPSPFGDLKVESSIISISAGHFKAPIYLGSWTDTTPATVNTSKLFVSGGTLFCPIETGTGDVINSSICITGGSLIGNNTGTIPTDSSNLTKLFKTTLSLRDSKGNPIKSTQITGISTNPSINYNLKDLVTDDKGNAYIFLPENTNVSRVSAGGESYMGSAISTEDNSGTGIFSPPTKTPITDVTLTPTTIKTGFATDLVPIVTPADASYENITLTIAKDGATNSQLRSNVITAQNPGTVTVLVAVEAAGFPPFTKEIIINVEKESQIEPDKLEITEVDGFTNIFTRENSIILSDAANGYNLFYDCGQINGELDKGDVWIDLSKDYAYPGNRESGFDLGKVNIIGKSQLITIHGGKVHGIVGENIKINGGLIFTDVALNGESQTLEITGGTVLARINFADAKNPKLYISGGNVPNSLSAIIKAPPLRSPSDSTKVYPTVFTLNCPKGALVTKMQMTPATPYGLRGTVADENGKLTAFLPQSTTTTKIYAGGKRYVNDAGITTSNVLTLGTLTQRDFISVSDISLKTSEIEVNSPTELVAQIFPFDAEKSQIDWSILSSGTTGANLKDGYITATNPGQIVLQGRIKNGLDDNLDYVKNFTINSILPEYSFTLSSYTVDFGTLLPGYNPVKHFQKINIKNTGLKPITIQPPTSTKCTVTLEKDNIAPEETMTIIFTPKENMNIGDHEESILIASSSKEATASISISYSVRQTLESIAPPKTVIGISSGAPKTAAGLNLPEVVKGQCQNTVANLPVTWQVDQCDYNPHSTSYQEFTVTGIVDIPPHLDNTNGIPKEITVKVVLNCLLEQSGISILGKISGTPLLTASDLSPDSSAYINMKQKLPKDMEIIYARDISITSGTLDGPCTLSFSVSSELSGLESVVVHTLANNNIDTSKVIIKDGKVTVDINELSPFMIAVPKRDTDSVSTPSQLNMAIVKAGKTPTVIELTDNIAYGPKDDPFPLTSDGHITLTSKDKPVALSFINQNLDIPKNSRLAFNSKESSLLSLNFETSSLENSGDLDIKGVSLKLETTDFTSKGNLRISDSTISSNQEITLLGDKSKSAVFSTTFTDFTGDSIIVAKDGASLTLEGSKFLNSILTNSALKVFNCQDVLIKNTNFDNLTSKGNGTIYFADSYGEIKNSSFLKCSSSFGGAIFLAKTSELNLKDGIISNCKSTGSGSAGGAIAITSTSKAIISGMEISYNSAPSGGGIYINTDSNVTDGLIFKSGRLYNNEATENIGGGILIDGNASARLDKTLVLNNQAGICGAGLYFDTTGSGLLEKDRGIAIFDNQSPLGKDVVVDPTPPNFSKRFTLPSHMLCGGAHNWKDNSGLSPTTDMYTNNPCINPISLSAHPNESDKGNSQNAASVIIENNKAQKGGGVAVRGKLLSGYSSSKKALLKKTDAGTNLPLSGAVFRLYNTNNESLGEYTTDINGEIQTGDLIPGENYYFVETKAPDGYIINQENNRYPIVGADSKTITVTNMPIIPVLTVSKSIREKDLLNSPITPDIDAAFEFTLNLNKSGEYTCYIGGEPTKLKSGDSFFLKHGQTGIFTDIPFGTEYTILEKNNYIDPVNNKYYIPTSKNSYGIIKEGGKIMAEFENIEVPEQIRSASGPLSSMAVVNRIIADERDLEYGKFFETSVTLGNDKTKSFSYQVVSAEEAAYYSANDPFAESVSAESNTNLPTSISDSPLKNFPVYKSTDNVVTARLNHKSVLLIYDLPVGTQYTVSQVDYSSVDGYSIHSTHNTQGLVMPDKNVLPHEMGTLQRTRADIFNYYARPVKFSINISTHWEGNGEKPEYAVVNLVDDRESETVVLSAQNDWSSTFQIETPEYQSLDYSLYSEEIPGYEWELVFDDSNVRLGKINHNWQLKNANADKESASPDADQKSHVQKTIKTTEKELFPYTLEDNSSPQADIRLLGNNNGSPSNSGNYNMMWIWAQLTSVSIIITIATTYRD